LAGAAGEFAGVLDGQDAIIDHRSSAGIVLRSALSAVVFPVDAPPESSIDTPTPQGPQRVELGTALIASAFAFAALTQAGRWVSIPYLGFSH
jgi:hypothetical protein